MCMAFLRSLGTLQWLFYSLLTVEQQLTQTVAAKGRLARGKASFKKKQQTKPQNKTKQKLEKQLGKDGKSFKNLNIYVAI